MKWFNKWIGKLFIPPTSSIRPKAEHPFIYPKNPKYNGNYCANHDDGLNIYDYLDDNGEIDWDALDRARKEVQEYKLKIWVRDYYDGV